MRPATLLLGLLSAVSLTSARGLVESREARAPDLSKRLLGTNLCANVATEVPLNVSAIGSTTVSSHTDVNVLGTVCLCIQAGVLTPGSQALINAGVLTNDNAAVTLLETGTGPLAPVLNPGLEFLLYTPATLELYLDFLTNTELVSMNDPGCSYPIGATPNSTDCSNPCGYACPANQRVCTSTNSCVDTSIPCQSGGSSRRRDLLSGPDIDMRCPRDMTACAIPDSLQWTGKNFECIDINVDLESCGACSFPLPGRPTGQDCTAIPHAASVACNAGQCRVDSCVRGYTVSSDSTGCVSAEGEVVIEARDDMHLSDKSKKRMNNWEKNKLLERFQVDTRKIRSEAKRASSRLFR